MTITLAAPGATPDVNKAVADALDARERKLAEDKGTVEKKLKLLSDTIAEEKSLTPEGVVKLTDNVVFSFDGDAAGRRAARKALEGALPFATDLRAVRFLFLPPEHDPDSFVREHGAEAFAALVNGATPLSRFLVDVAREDCDLASAEGRARMAANAKPLWLQLPEGGLKHQVLLEISALALMEAGSLAGLWGVTPRRGQAAPAARIDTAPATLGQSTAASRLDRVLQIVLGDSQAWGWLSLDAQGVLCSLPAPHGPLFLWLDAHYLEHGPQAGAAIAEALEGHAHALYARQQLAAMPRGLESDPGELQALLASQRA